MEETPKPKSRRNKIIGWAVILLLVGLYIWWVEDWYQLWKIASAPDNVPIVGMLFLVPFFTWLGVRQAVANDQLIDRLEADPKLAKSHHRKAEPWRPGWAKELHVWPYLVRIEFSRRIVQSSRCWAITLNARSKSRPIKPDDDPSKAPWYFWVAGDAVFSTRGSGVVMPSLIMIGLMVFPYVDSNPLGNGYYTFRQRRFAIWMFGVGFLTWIVLIFIGTFIRGPGWIWFWPGQTWDHNTVVFDRNRDLHEIIAGWGLPFLNAYPWKAIFGAIVVGGFFIVGGLFFHWWMMRAPFKLRYLKSWTALKNWATGPANSSAAARPDNAASIHDVFSFSRERVLAMPGKLF